MLPRIFIGGTGRSGTSIVYQALGCHEAIHSFPEELRFLVDPDGLMNLLDALTSNYSPIQAREALYRFERLMRVYLTVPQRAPYRGFDLATWLGDEYYWQRLDQFCSELVELEFNGTAWQVEPEREGNIVAWARQLQAFYQRLQGRPVLPFKLTLPREKMKVVNYFPERKQLFALAARFVEDLFAHALVANGKQTWCEKTPQNIFHMGFLWELFPQSVFIHIKRDPRGIIHSMTKQTWKRAPSDVEGASLFLRGLYDCWFDIKVKTDLASQQYLEVKIEDIAASSRCELEKIILFCGIEGRFGTLPDISLNRVNDWQKTMSKQNILLVNQILGSYIERMGYEV